MKVLRRRSLALCARGHGLWWGPQQSSARKVHASRWCRCKPSSTIINWKASSWRETVITRPLLATLACPLFMLPVQAQDFPDGPGKQIVTAVCGGCHDINRIKVGYTPEGWRTVIRMMQNVQTPVPADQWATVTEYLIN